MFVPTVDRSCRSGHGSVSPRHRQRRAGAEEEGEQRYRCLIRLAVPASCRMPCRATPQASSLLTSSRRFLPCPVARSEAAAWPREGPVFQLREVFAGRVHDRQVDAHIRSSGGRDRRLREGQVLPGSGSRTGPRDYPVPCHYERSQHPWSANDTPREGGRLVKWYGRIGRGVGAIDKPK